MEPDAYWACTEAGWDGIFYFYVSRNLHDKSRPFSVGIAPCNIAISCLDALSLISALLKTKVVGSLMLLSCLVQRPTYYVLHDHLYVWETQHASRLPLTLEPWCEIRAARKHRRPGELWDASGEGMALLESRKSINFSSFSQESRVECWFPIQGSSKQADPRKKYQFIPNSRNANNPLG